METFALDFYQFGLATFLTTRRIVKELKIVKMWCFVLVDVRT